MNVEVYGAVIVNRWGESKRDIVKTELEDNEILKVLDMTQMMCMYGKGWVFGGDQGFKESNILVVIKREGKKDYHETFVGRSALRDFINFCTRNKITAAMAQEEVAS